MTDYATLAQLTNYLGITGTVGAADQLNLQMALTNASATIDDQTQRSFAAAVDSTRYHDALRDVEGLRLWLNGDLAQVTSVTNGDGQPVLLTSFVTEPANMTPFFALTLKRNSGLWWTYNNSPEAAIAVTGRWAYSVAPPNTIVQATLRLASWYYRQPSNALDLDRAVIVGNTTIAPSMIPADVFVLLRPYSKVVVP